MRVGLTGTSRGCSGTQLVHLEHTLRTLRDDESAAELHHGDCVGADAQGHDIARRLGYRIVLHPPLKQNSRAHCQADEVRQMYEYLQRDRHIVEDTDMLVACPIGPEQRRSGTWTTVRHARRLGRRILIVWPGGEVTEEPARSTELPAQLALL